MYDALVESYRGLPVVEIDRAASWRGPQMAYRLREEYDDKIKIADRLAAILAQPDCDQLSTLIIGTWTGAMEGTSSKEMVRLLVDAAPKLSGLRHLFFGEITYEECEISWIVQCDISPLLNAYPRLESFRVRGGNGLSFSKVRHDHLKELGVETGGLSRNTIREIFQCEFPALERLELLLGDPAYGFDATVEDLQPLLAGSLYPKLKFLGLMNSDIADDIAAVLVNSPIVNRLETIDLSLGTLSDEGVRSLHGLARHDHLKQLNISHHYASEAELASLVEALPFQVVAEDPQDPNDEWRSVVHAE